MTDQPPNRERLIEVLESIRADSDDPRDPALADVASLIENDPEVAALYWRLKQSDRQLAESLDDVPVPEGLHQQILVALADAELTEDILAPAGQSVPAGVSVAAREEGTEPDRPQPDVAPPVARRPYSRRWLVAGGGLLAAAVGLFLAVWLGYDTRPTLTADALLDAARGRFLGTRAGGHDGPSYPISVRRPPAEHPPSPAVKRIRGTRWRESVVLLERRAVAYDIPLPAGRTATLYVVRAEAAEPLPTRPPDEPGQSTGGISLSAWQEGDLLYVLAVDGGPRIYRHLIAPPSGPLT